jgi:hypothetical protein
MENKEEFILNTYKNRSLFSFKVIPGFLDKKGRKTNEVDEIFVQNRPAHD